MACCGQSRRSHASPDPVHPTRFAGVSGVPIFEYVGATSLTVIGSGTGREYRFERGGARVEIDGRDQVSVARVPNLRRIIINR
jgi:hypothetical protein